jgi:oligopeptide transport system permease protein
MLYLLKKLAYLCLSLFLIMTLTFVLMKAIPGDPFGEEQGLPKEVHEALRQHYGLDLPWHQQYGRYLVSLLQGDLGPSFKYKNRTVNAIIKEGFPVSAMLGMQAFLVALTSGLLLGAYSALNAHRWQDHLLLLFTTIGISVPSFILATLLQYLLAFKFGWLPLARWGSWSQTLLPTLALAALPTAFITRLVRANLLQILQEDFIKTAKAKGLSPIVIIWRHALRNALLPVCAYLGQLLSNILFGSFIVEKIFSIPGLGQWFVNSVSARDYPVIMGLTLFYSTILMSCIFLVDYLYGILDPRIRMNKGRA